MHGITLRQYGSMYWSLNSTGKRSVEKREVTTKARIRRNRFSYFNPCEKNQIATPVMAIIKVADSAL